MPRRAAGGAAAAGARRTWDTCGTLSPPRPPPSAARGSEQTARRCPRPRCSSSAFSSLPPFLLAEVRLVPLAIPSWPPALPIIGEQGARSLPALRGSSWHCSGDGSGGLLPVSRQGYPVLAKHSSTLGNRLLLKEM